MALEKRGKNFYYYEKIREGDKVRSVYSGKGETALLLDIMRQWKNDEIKGKNKERKIENTEKYKERIKKEYRNKPENSITDNTENELENIAESYADFSRILTDAFLFTNGFHQHKRQWRKKRNGRENQRT